MRTAPVLVHRAIAAWAKRAPSAPALRWRGTTLSYASLDAWSDSFAQVVAASGRGPGALVGVIASRSPATVACFLGILKAGATYVPIYTEYPEERIRFILSDEAADLACVFYDSGAFGGLPGAPSVPMDTVPATGGPAPRVDVDPGTVAYIVYTSGSTGVPKGVMVTHRSLAAVVPELVAAYSIRPRDRVLHCAPLGFDTSVSEILRGLCAGACLCIAPADVTVKPDFFYRLKFLAEERVTRAVLPAALLRAAKPVPLPELDVLVTTGEASTKELVDKWAPGRTLLNAWGSTEGTLATTIMRLVQGGGERQPVGRPIRGTEVFVVGDDGDEVPAGEVGQIHIGGVGVAAGYYRRPGLTAERFVPNAWGSLSPTAFATGDLGALLPDGHLDCFGRLDNQVKVSGFRVDVAEVETALRACERVSVRDAAVVAVESQYGDTALVANLVLEPPRDSRPLADRERAVDAAIKEDLKRVLPDYALPRAVRLWDALPLNAHGKIDRGRLTAECTKR